MPADTGATSRRGIPRATRCTRGCSAFRVVSRRSAKNPKADPDYLEIARQELYRGQCNCPYWHGSFGGLYLPHLRNAIYRALITAHNALDDAEGRTGPRALIEVGDFNLDARQEVRLENDRLIAWVRPARGGHIYELDVRENATNLLATLDRRPEAYHADILAAAAVRGNGQDGSGHDGQRKRVAGTDHIQATGPRPSAGLRPSSRKALVDHFYPVDVSLDDLIAGREVELGDFVLGTYLAKVQREPQRVAVVMERPGRVDGHPIRIKKTIELLAGEPGLSVHYELDDLPAGVCFHFAVEINLAAMAGHAPDRFYSDTAGNKLGMLDERIDLPHTSGVTATDEWLDLTRRPHLVASGRPLVLPDRDGQPERGGNRRGVPIVGRHPPLARDGRRKRLLGRSSELAL